MAGSNGHKVSEEIVRNRDIANEGRRLYCWIEDLADQSAGDTEKRRVAVDKMMALTPRQLAAVLVAITLYEESVAVVRAALEMTTITTGAVLHMISMGVPEALNLVKEIKTDE